MPRVTVEFYGLARVRAGRPALTTDAATVGAALGAADTACPGLRVLGPGGIAPEFLVSVGGGRFTTNPADRLKDGESVLVFGADAGG